MEDKIVLNSAITRTLVETILEKEIEKKLGVKILVELRKLTATNDDNAAAVHVDTVLSVGREDLEKIVNLFMEKGE